MHSEPASPKPTLVDIARAHTARPRHQARWNDDEIELALAWVRDEVGLNAVAAAYGLSSAPNAMPRIASCLRAAYRKGLLTTTA